jgi:hypothetical protein
LSGINAAKRGGRERSGVAEQIAENPAETKRKGLP